MKTVFLFSCLFFEGASIHIQGMERGHVSFHCFHSYASTNSKYLCRDPCKQDEDRVITVNSGQTAESGRFSLQDKGNTLMVNISRLQLSDAGVYFCGVDRVGFDTFIQVHLTVDEEPPTTHPPTPVTTTTPELLSSLSASTSTQFTCESCTKGTNVTTGGEQFVIPGAALYTCLGAAALLAILVMAICFRKCRNRSKAPGPLRMSNSYFVAGHKPVVSHKSLAVSESALQPSKEKAASSTCDKQAARQKQKRQQKHRRNAKRNQPSAIYENTNFHKGAASSSNEAANVHDEDDMCAIYNNVEHKLPM